MMHFDVIKTESISCEPVVSVFGWTNTEYMCLETSTYPPLVDCPIRYCASKIHERVILVAARISIGRVQSV